MGRPGSRSSPAPGRAALPQAPPPLEPAERADAQTRDLLSPSVKGAALGLRGNQRVRGSAAAHAAPGEIKTSCEPWASWLRRPRLGSPPARPRCPRLGSQDPPAKPAATLRSPAVTGVAGHR